MIRTHALDPLDRTRAVRAETKEFMGWRVPLMDSSLGPSAPNAKIIEQQPGWVIPPHFHACHQFQVVTAGSGRLGRKPVRPLTVHYTSPEAAYGPIEAGEDGLSYYVLRPQVDPGARYMPQSRGLMREGLPKHHAVSEPIDVRDAPGRAMLSAPVIAPCLPLTAEGMAVWHVGLPPGTSLEAGALPGEGARFYLVAAGELAQDGEILAAGSLQFAEHADRLCLQATRSGADILVLQFPPVATAGA